MTYASVLVGVDEGPTSESRIKLACDVAMAFGAHLTGVCVGSIAPPLYDPFAGGAMVGELLTLYRSMAEAEVERGRDSFELLTRHSSLERDWRGQIGYPSDVVARTARAADLLILGSRNGRAPYHAPDVADVLMRCGLPVLVVPPTFTRQPVAGHVLVAWKDTREARRALTSALPLLKRARGVTLYSIREADDNDSADAELADVVQRLARHEIAAEPVIALATSDSAGRQILDEAVARNAGLVVAGAYGHARLQEWALGGVTRDLLADSPVCLLLAH